MPNSQVRVLNFSAAYTTLTKDGLPIFLKIRASDVVRKRNLKHAFAAEQVALEALGGLAVPRLVDPDSVWLASKDSSWLRGPSRDHFGQLLIETYEGEPLHDHFRDNNYEELLGVWIFCLEQFVAFRRHQLIYSDAKCTNIVARGSKKKRVTIVDFDRVVPIVGRRIDWTNFGLTRGFDPPELRTTAKPTEAACVYQVAALLMHFLTNADNRSLNDRRRGLPRAHDVLTKIGASDFSKILRRCLNVDPTQRNPTYESLFAEVAESKVPNSSRLMWDELRTPYLSKLAEVDLA